MSLSVAYVGSAATREDSIARAQERFGEDGGGPASGPFAGNPWIDFSWTAADLKVRVRETGAKRIWPPQQCSPGGEGMRG